MAYATVTLTGTYQRLDGTPANGQVVIAPSVERIIDGAGNVILSGRRTVQLDDTGSFSVVLPATDDPALDPTGFVYVVAVSAAGTRIPTVVVELPAGTPTIDMADVTPVDPAEPSYRERVEQATIAAADAEGSAVEAAGSAAAAAGSATAAASSATAADQSATAAASSADDAASTLTAVETAGTTAQQNIATDTTAARQSIATDTTAARESIAGDVSAADADATAAASSRTAAETAAGDAVVAATAAGASADAAAGSATAAADSATAADASADAAAGSAATAGSAVATHEAKPDPHAQYALKTALPAGAVGASAASIATTESLNNLTKTGTYYRGQVSTADPSGDPYVGWTGTVETIRRFTDDFAVQFAYPVATAGVSARPVYVRTRNAGTWYPWVSLIDSNLYKTGAGMPEGVVAAAVGTKYVDTLATNGAVEWVKASGSGTTGWQVVYGDTGWRSWTVNTPPASGDSFTGVVRLRRVGRRVSLKFDGATLQPGNGYAYIFDATLSPLGRVPDGFRGPLRSFGWVAKHNNAVDPERISHFSNVVAWVGTGVASGSNVVRPALALLGDMDWLTEDSWPVVLPGNVVI